MYQNIHFERNKNIVHIWDDTRGYFTYPYQKYAYVKDPKGSFVSLDGTRLKMIQSWDNSISETLYESDLMPEMRTLIDLYHQSDRPSENHSTMFFDIEISIKNGFPSVLEASEPIISIACYIREQGIPIVFILDEGNRIKNSSNGKKILAFKTERNLLNAFIDYVIEKRPTIISGWNSDLFDVPYLYRRLVKILGERRAKEISPIGIVEEYNDKFQIAGVNSLDYMRLFKTFTQGERSSYSLDFISKLELGRGKIKHQGLDKLYNEDLEKFIDYNLEDVLLIKDLDLKLNFIELAQAICHKGHVQYENIYQPSIYLDGAALTFTKNAGVVCPNRKPIFKFQLLKPAEIGDTVLEFNSEVKNIPPVGKLKIYKTKTTHFTIVYKKFSENYIILESPLTDRIKQEYEIHLELIGAFVQEPVPGLYDWVYDLDLQSLYPSIIMSLNISPETKVGRVLDWKSEDFITKKDRSYHIQIKHKKEKMTFKEIEEFLISNNYGIAANGVFYKQDSVGFLPTILNNWFDERKDLKKKRDEFGNAGNKEKYKYYDLLQFVYKVLLNSFYGVLALPSFRFNDLDNAEAITSSGQQIIKFSAKITNQYYQQELDTKNDYVIASDTDSLFCTAQPFIKESWTDDEKIKKILEVATNVKDHINMMYDKYALKFHNVHVHRFYIKQEVISKAIFLVAKKRYVQLMIYKEGLKLDPPEIDVKGLDVVRSDFSVAFRAFMKEILIDILNKKTNNEVNEKIILFKEKLEEFSLDDFMFPTGVKNVSKYDISRGLFQSIKGAPIHVKASLFYNDLLKVNKLKTGYITDSEKIKYAYLRSNPYNIETIALKDNAPQIIIDFIEKYIDKEKMFESRIKNKLDDFYLALKWEMILNKNIEKFFSF